MTIRQPEPMSLISLREHIERSGDRRAAAAAPEAPASAPRSSRSGGSATDAALAGYREAISAMGSAGERAVPPVSQEFNKSLAALAERLAPGSSSETIQMVGNSVNAEISQWGDSAAKYFKEKTDAIREIVMVVARTAEVVGERDTRYAGQFENLTGRLREIAKLDNFAHVRRNLIESAAQLTACVSKMTEEGQRAMEDLKAQVTAYRTKLEEAERLASIDPLTGLANRRAAEEALAGRILHARPFCVILLDLNGFKKVNDSLGHTAGDDILKQFATELRAQFAPSDVVGRLGGDEFIGIHEGGIEQARKYKDRIERWAFGDYDITAGSKAHKVPLAAAIGIAEWDGTETARDLIARADRELYGSKAIQPVK